jgi:hypothetical protein
MVATALPRNHNPLTKARWCAERSARNETSVDVSRKSKHELERSEKWLQWTNSEDILVPFAGKQYV